MLAKPASSIAAAAEALTGTRMSRPSTVTPTVATVLSGRLRNIEALGGERRQYGIERARRDHWREGVGVRAGEGHAAVAIGGESAGEFLAFVVDRLAVRRHHPQGGPSPHNLQLGDIGKGLHRAAGDGLHHVGLLPSVEADLLLAGTDHDAALQRLAQAAQRDRPDAPGALGDEDLAALRPHRRAEPKKRRQSGVAEPSGEHDLWRGDLLGTAAEAEIVGLRGRIIDRAV